MNHEAKKAIQDMVNQPKHYQMPIEPLDFFWANRDFIDGLQANVIKYVIRYKRKNGVEDLEKAKVYLQKMIDGLLLANASDEQERWDSFEPCSHEGYEIQDVGRMHKCHACGCKRTWTNRSFYDDDGKVVGHWTDWQPA